MLPSTVTPSEFWWIGVLLDMIATLAGTIGKQLLRYAVLTKEMRYYPLGLFFTAVVDPVFDLSAYSFAAQSIIAPCAGMVVVWNVLLAPYTLQEKLTASRLIGAVLVCIGTVIMGLCGNHDEVDRTVAEYIALFSRPAAIIYYALFTLYCGAMTYVILRKGRFASSFAQVALGGSFAGNMFTTKAVVEMADCFRDYDRTAEEIEGCSPNPFLGPTPYLFASVSLALACISLWLLAVGLRDFEALYMITVFEGFMIISGAVSGNVVMNEAAHQQTYELVLYAMSIGIILCGLYVLCRGEQPRGDDAQQRMLARCRVGDGEGSEMTSSTSEIKQARDDEHERDKAPL